MGFGLIICYLLLFFICGISKLCLHSENEKVVNNRVRNTVTSRRSRIFLRGRPLSCEVPSRRGSVGGGSSNIFPWSPKADAIQWGVGGGVVAELFR